MAVHAHAVTQAMSEELVIGAIASICDHFASSGIYNPRSRFYLEGHLTKPIQYEFSFQQTFDSTNLLDAYVNFNYDPRFQVRIGRYVAQDVLVSLGQEFGARVAQVVGVEYAVGTHVAVRASTSTRGASAVDLIWQHRY